MIIAQAVQAPYTAARHLPKAARSAVACGARVLWFQLGTHTDEAVRLAEQAGITVVVDHCMMPEHRRLVGER